MKLNLKQLTEEQLQRVLGGAMGDDDICICRCTYAPPPNSENRNDTKKYCPPEKLPR